LLRRGEEGTVLLVVDEATAVLDRREGVDFQPLDQVIDDL
jgi:hypothetical protein